MQVNIKEIIKKYTGNGYLEINLEDRAFTSIGYSGNELETMSRANTFLGSIRLFENGFWYFISFMDDNIERHFETIKEMAKSGEGREGSIANFKKVVDKIKTKSVIDPINVALSEKHDLIKSYNDMIINNKLIQTSRSVYRDVVKKKYYANSEQSYIEQEKTFSGFSCAAIAKEGMNVQTATFSNAGYGGFELVKDYEDKVEETVKIALEMLNAPVVEGGRYNVILDNQMTGVFTHEAFGHLSEADFLYENPDMLKMMSLGREFGKDIVNIIDDGSLEGLAGYTPYDDEGIPAKRTELIKDGKLNARLTSRETAKKLDEPLSGNARILSPYFSPQVRMTNTFIDNGESTFDEIIGKCENGIYVKGFIGGMTNLEQFTFTPKSAYYVKDGKIASPVREVVLSGNVFETIKNISAVGNDLKHFGSLGGCGKGGQNGLPVTIGGPHILLENVLVGGR